MTDPYEKRYPRTRGFVSGVPCGDDKPWHFVTNLDDEGPGSLRNALSVGDRNVAFEVGGTIVLRSPLNVAVDNISVHGETAPYPGVIIQKCELQSRGSNQRFSHLTLEKGHDKSSLGVDNGDCVKISPGSPSSTWSRSNIHFSHCLFLWSQDEMIEMWPSGGKLSGVSFTDCIFAEALWKPQKLGFPAHVKVQRGIQSQHNYGMIIGFGTKKVDVQNCVFSDMDMRFPFIDHSTSVVLANNIALNTTKGATIQHNSNPPPKEKMLVTCKGYLCISGPNSTPHSGFRFHSHAQPMKAGTRVHVSGLHGWRGASEKYITPGRTVQYSVKGRPFCVEKNRRVSVEVPKPPIDIPGAPVKASGPDEIFDRAVKNCGPFPKTRFGHSERVIAKLRDKKGRWVNHESEVGGRTPFVEKVRKLDGTSAFDDGIAIPPPPQETDPAAVNAWLEEFRKRIQYD